MESWITRSGALLPIMSFLSHRTAPKMNPNIWEYMQQISALLNFLAKTGKTNRIRAIDMHRETHSTKGWRRQQLLQDCAKNSYQFTPECHWFFFGLAAWFLGYNLQCGNSLSCERLALKRLHEIRHYGYRFMRGRLTAWSSTSSTDFVDCTHIATGSWSSPLSRCVLTLQSKSLLGCCFAKLSAAWSSLYFTDEDRNNW